MAKNESVVRADLPMSRRTMIFIAITLAVVTAGVFVWRWRQLSTSVSTTSTLPTSAIQTIYPNPYDSPQQFMEGIYTVEHGTTSPTTNTIRALIVPHHLTATETIASGIAALRGQSFDRILLVSPDHFHACPTPLCTVDAVYQTWFGNVTSSPQTLDAFRTSPLVTFDPDLFKKEHGIYAVLPYIVHLFPGVPVTPLAVSDWSAHRDDLLSLIRNAVDERTLLIVSSDFSHYLPLATANVMDDKTWKALSSHNLDDIAHLNNADQSDCPGCLWLLTSLASERHFYQPTVIMHTNSAVILHDDNATQTTSHFSIMWTDEATDTKR